MNDHFLENKLMKEAP